MQRLSIAAVLLLFAATAIAADAPPPPRPQTRPAAAAPRPAPPAVAPLRPYTAFAWAFPGIQPHVKTMFWLRDDTVVGVAARTTARMDEGARVVLTVDYTRGICHHPDDVCRKADGEPTKQMGVWPENGVRTARERFERFLEDFTAAGGKIDFLALDNEEGYSAWGMTEERLDAVQADPRFLELSRRLGFADARRALFKNDGRRDYLTWSVVMARTVSDATDRAMLEPLRRHFPRAGMSNFNEMAMSQAQSVPDINGHPDYRLGEPTGTHQSPGVYGGASPHVAVKADWNRPFMQILHGTNWIRAGVRTSARPMIPWMAFKNFLVTGPERTTVIGRTDYWEENAWQVMLSGGTTNVFYWNPTVQKASLQAEPDLNTAQPSDNDAMEAVMAEYDKQARRQAVTATVTTDRVPWDAGFVVSAVRLADGSILGRVTFAEGVNQAEFELDGKTMKVERPSGKLGMWVRQP